MIEKEKSKHVVSTFAIRMCQRYNLWSIKDLANSMIYRLTYNTKEEHRSYNNGIANQQDSRLIEHSTSYQLLWCFDSFGFRNSQLLKFVYSHPPFFVDLDILNKNIIKKNNCIWD